MRLLTLLTAAALACSPSQPADPWTPGDDGRRRPEAWVGTWTLAPPAAEAARLRAVDAALTGRREKLPLRQHDQQMVSWLAEHASTTPDDPDVAKARATAAALRDHDLVVVPGSLTMRLPSDRAVASWSVRDSTAAGWRIDITPANGEAATWQLTWRSDHLVELTPLTPPGTTTRWARDRADARRAPKPGRAQRVAPEAMTP